METKTQWEVGMSCEGCATAVKSVLGKTAGVTSVQTDVASKKVTVSGTASSADILAAIKKTGKSVQQIS